MANIFINPPDELEDEQNPNVVNLHTTVTTMVNTLNYALSSIDDENLTEELLNKINGE